MYEEEFAERLVALRMKKGVSARDMSLSIGQNAGYINNIENGKALPSMTSFFYICDYLDISPKQFFDIEIENPSRLDNIMPYLRRLSSSQLDHLTALVKDIVKK